MSLLMLGLNHRTAPVEVREKLAFSREGAATALMLFHKLFPTAEAVILSTCNRVEIMVNSEDGSVGAAEVMAFLSQARDVPVMDFKPHLFQFEGRAAMRHLFGVISGLDSMVLGEYQIVNQVKQAYQLAHEQQTAGPVLHRMFHHAFGVGKRSRSETGICDGKTSLPSVAVEVIRNAMADFQEKRILIVGAGEMAQLTAEYLREAEARDFVVATRTLANGRALASSCQGRAVPFHELDAQLAEADIVVTATSCPMPILTVPRVIKALSGRASCRLLLVDLAVPRNIEAECGEIAGVKLHDVDSLGQIVAENARARQAAVEQCERIIEEEVEVFEKWLKESKVRPLIEQMFEDVRALAQMELRSTLSRCPDLSDKQRDAVTQLAERIVGKLMHPCVTSLRQAATGGSALALVEAFRATRMSFAQRDSIERGCPAQVLTT